MPNRLMPKGLRPRLLMLVIASVACSALLLARHEMHRRDEAIQRVRGEAAVLSRLAAARTAQSLAGAIEAPRSSARELQAVVLAARDAGAVVRAGYGARLPEAVSFLVVDRHGHVMAEPGAGRRHRDSLVGAFEARAASEWEQEIRGADGHRRIVAFTPLPHAGDTALWVGAGLDLDALLADQTRGLWLSLLAFFLFGIVISFTTWFFSVGVLRRVDALLEASRRLGEGDLAARTGLADASGELGALARQFDSMAEALQRQADERARAEERLRLSEARKSAVLEASVDGIVLLDGLGRMLECNSSARRMFGCDGRCCVHHTLSDIFPDSLPFDPRDFNRAGEVFEASCCRLDASRFPVEVSIAPIRDAAATGLFAATLRDVTERKLWEHSLETLSFMDELTGLYNRRGFLMFAAHQLKLAARSNQSVVLVGVDMDGLKTINDTFGHANGDRALIELSRALRASFRDSDVVGRIGGDEFVVLATEALEEGAEHALERFTMRIAGRNNEGDLPWPLSASVGWVRTQPTEPEDLGELLARVDERMYEQKRRRCSEGRAHSGLRLSHAPHLLPDLRVHPGAERRPAADRAPDPGADDGIAGVAPQGPRVLPIGRDVSMARAA